MTALSAAELLHLVDRAEAGRLLPAEARILRDGITALAAERDQYAAWLQDVLYAADVIDANGIAWAASSVRRSATGEVAAQMAAAYPTAPTATEEGH